MTGSTAWHVDPATHGLLAHVESLGYAVSVHRLPSSLLGTVGASVEMHAVRLGTPPEVHVARVDDGHWKRTASRASELARTVQAFSTERRRPAEDGACWMDRIERPRSFAPLDAERFRHLRVTL